MTNDQLGPSEPPQPLVRPDSAMPPLPPSPPTPPGRSPVAIVAFIAALVVVASVFAPWATRDYTFSTVYPYMPSVTFVDMLSSGGQFWLVCTLLGGAVALAFAAVATFGSLRLSSKVALGGFVAAAFGAILGISTAFGGTATSPDFGAWLFLAAACVGTVSAAVLVRAPGFGVSASGRASSPWPVYPGAPYPGAVPSGPPSYIPASYAPPSYAPPPQSAWQQQAWQQPPAWPPPPPQQAWQPQPPAWQPPPPQQAWQQPPAWQPQPTWLGYQPAPAHRRHDAHLAALPGWLVVIDRGYSTTYSVEVGHGFTVGRNSGCSIVFADPRVAERQVAIERRGEGWLVQNVDPANPTWLVDQWGRPQPIEWEIGLQSGQLAIGTATLLLYPVMP